jgi:hypothetical protein
MPPIDISQADAILLDGTPIPIGLLRALTVTTSGRIRIERDDASTEEIEITRDGDTGPGAAFNFIRHPRSRAGTDRQPVPTEWRAELVSPDGKSREMIDRDSARAELLMGQGWTETGRTRPRTPER